MDVRGGSGDIDANILAKIFGGSDEGTESPKHVKYDHGKPRWTLVPWDAMADVVDVLGHGAQKYSDDNWKHCDKPKRYLDAAFRHLIAYAEGNMVDEDTGMPTLAHVTCCLLFLASLDKVGK